MKIEAKTDREILISLATKLEGMDARVGHIDQVLTEHNAQTAEIADKCNQNELNHLELKSQISGGVTAVKWIFGISAGVWTLIQVANFIIKLNG